MNTPSDEAEAAALHEALDRAADSNPALAKEYTDLVVDLGCGPEAYPPSSRPADWPVPPPTQEEIADWRRWELETLRKLAARYGVVRARLGRVR